MRVDEWGMFVSGGQGLVGVYEEIAVSLANNESLGPRDLLRRWARFLRQGKPAEATSSDDLPSFLQTESLSKEQVMLAHVFIVAISYMSTQIPGGPRAYRSVQMSLKWQAGLFVLVTSLLCAQSPKVDPTSVVKQFDIMDRVRLLIDQAVYMVVANESQRQHIVDYMVGVVENTFELQKQFRTNLIAMSGDGFNCSPVVHSVASWESVKAVPVTTSGRMQCWLSLIYFEAAELCMVEATSYGGETTRFPAHASMVPFLRVAHIHLNMGNLLFRATHHLHTDLAKWVADLGALFQTTSANFATLMHATITRLAIEDALPNFLV